MKRKEGFYWVRFNDGDWVVAQWFINYWLLPGTQNKRPDEYFLEINEAMIFNSKSESSSPSGEQGQGVREELYVWNGIECQLDEIENFDDLKEWIKDYTEEEEGVHPDIESIIVLKKIGGIECIPVEGKENTVKVKSYRINGS